MEHIRINSLNKVKYLKLENIGLDMPTHRRPYCKQVITIGKNGFLVTRPMQYNRDYAEANSVGSRGIFDYYVLHHNALYEINEPVTWKRCDHYYLYIDPNGDEYKMTREEVMICLSNGSISMCSTQRGNE